MSYERPSQKKVVGVAYAYLRSLERIHTLDNNIARFTSVDLQPGSATILGSSIGVAALREWIASPLNRRREAFLSHAQEVEGRVPGEESLAVYALNRLSVQERQKFPETVRANIQDGTQ